MVVDATEEEGEQIYGGVSAVQQYGGVPQSNATPLSDSANAQQRMTLMSSAATNCACLWLCWNWRNLNIVCLDGEMPAPGVAPTNVGTTTYFYYLCTEVFCR